ncbi:MAG: hypothetical protein CMJ78_15825 [Planctomycetaceae bacterium]|nr:hypothetical protein [Planctomycetaceae bacterium]
MLVLLIADGLVAEDKTLGHSRIKSFRLTIEAVEIEPRSAYRFQQVLLAMSDGEDQVGGARTPLMFLGNVKAASIDRTIDILTHDQLAKRFGPKQAMENSTDAQ